MSSSHSHIGPHLEHTGTEPKKAMSAYGLRLALALGALVVFAAFAVWALVTPGLTDGVRILGAAGVVAAVVAAVDSVVVVRRMRGDAPRHRA